MSTGGVFKLIVNDGKSDRMILATKLLYQRIQDIMYMRSQQGRDDITPTLIDLERTHIVFVNAHFKPFAAIGYEYNKVKPQSGNSMLGSGVTFSIPQFGDFFHDMVCRTRIAAVYAATGTTPAQSSAVNAIFPTNTAAAAVGYNYNIVDSMGNVIVTGTTVPTTNVASYRNHVRYCEFPGNRLFTKVKFDVNGNPLDEYDQYVPVMLEKFTVQPHKRDGYNRLCGQQVPIDGVSGINQCPVFDADNTTTPGWNQLPSATKTTTFQSTLAYNAPAGITRFDIKQSNQTVALFQPQYANTVANDGLSTLVGASLAYSLSAGVSGVPPATALVAPTYNALDAFVTPLGGPAVGDANLILSRSTVDVSQQLKTYVNGPQTPKPIQPPLEIWNKLKFWFNDDVRLSIPSVSIPYGQRFITIELNQASNLVYEVPSIFVESIQFNTTATAAGAAGSSVLSVAFGNTVGAAIPATGVVGGYVREVRTYTPIVQYNGITSPGIEAMELYINNIFVNPEIHDIFIKRIGFALIRVYRQQKSTVNTAGQTDLLLSALKWPVEYMFVGVQPVFNQKDATANGTGYVQSGNVNVWRDWHRMTRQLPADASVPTIARTCVTGSSQGQVDQDKYYIPVSTVDSLSLTSHGITIFDNFQDTFFTSYAPYHYGTETVVTPADTGAFFINMTLFPRMYQPSGHLNISRARETYLIFHSSYVSSATPCMVIIVAIAINFILISDGSAVLRYST
jgi:hypothetical protein